MEDEEILSGEEVDNEDDLDEGELEEEEEQQDGEGEEHDPDDELDFRADAEQYAEKLKKRGVIYLSRIPPFMKPNKARSTFEQYGEVTRLYLAEEDVGKRQKRKTHGGNGSKQFVEGWIEFADKSIAKRVAQSLNNMPISRKKGDFYHDDIWNMKYLKNFKWEYLTEKLAYERRVRESKLKASMLQAKRQNAEFIELVEKSKVEEHVQERKKKRRKEGEVGVSAAGGGAAEVGESKKEKKARSFRQHQAIAIQHGESVSKPARATLTAIFQRNTSS